ncbi:MAG TPA: histidine kinase [Bacteroidia bacterium]|jgi:ligand-binding sensor domain-containing protein|nr:histidine kinase [Bacteroidia bacterium]
MKRILFLFFLLLLFISASAQELYFKSIPALQNLPSLETYLTFQDSKGFIWICSDGGLSRYDGNNVTIFTTKDGICENTVMSAYEDKKGRIWFATLSGSFFYYANNEFHSINANKSLHFYFRFSAPTTFFIGENDTLFCSPHSTTGFLKIPPQNNYGRIINIKNENILKVNRFLISNKLNPGETITGGGCAYADPTSFGFLWDNKLYDISYQNVNKTFCNFVKMIGNKKGNIAYLPKGMELTIVKKNNNEIRHLYFKQEIIYIKSETNGDLWVLCRKDGGYLYKNGDLNSKPIRFLQGLSVSSVMIDREGNSWATTLEKGVFICNTKNILTIPIADTEIPCVQVDSNKMCVAYQSKKILTFFRTDSIVADSLPSPSPAMYRLLSYLDVGDEYYYFTNNLFYVSKQEKGTPLFLSVKGGEITTWKGDTILSIGVSDVTRILNGKILSVTKFYSTNNCFIKRHDGSVLIGTRDENGIFQYKSDRLIPYLPQFNELKTRINYMAEDKQNRLWIATDEKGIFCYDEHGKLHQFADYIKKTGDKINALTVDQDNNIWCSSGNGLFKITTNHNLTKLSIQTFNRSCGLPDIRIERLVSFNSKIWCFTKNCVFYFNQDSLQKNNHPPLTNIYSLSINGIQVPVSDKLTVEYDQNNFKIICSQSSYKSFDNRGFMYKLNGFDNQWHYTNSTDIQYTNLDQGNYELLIYGLNNDGLKGVTPARFTLIIKRPFWYTWWFITLIIILFVILIYIGARYWKHKIEKKEQEKAQVNQKIAEFKMTALRSQMNPHFIFNAIGSIQHFILQNEAKQSYNYLAKFSMLIRNILNNSKEEYISLEQEITTLQLYIELEQIRFENPFKFIIDIEETIDMEMDIPTMLIQPYIENSIWHGLMPKGKGGILELLFKKTDNSLHVTIRDNGVGRKPKAPSQHVSKGMSITEQRIKTLEATNHRVYSTRIIDLKDKNNSINGTEVNLIIPID